MDRLQIGPYRVLGTLGEGGMGVVYRAVHPVTGDAVAIKTAHARVGDLARFRQEIRALSQVRHPRVVRVVAEGVDGGLPWYAMELVEGPTLRAFNEALWGPAGASLGPEEASRDASTLRSGADDAGAAPPRPVPAGVRPAAEPRLPVAGGRLGDVLSLYRRLCVPIGALHSQGIVHRDLKPANIVVRPDGSPVLMDLGVASGFHGAVGRERLEVGGAIVGTLAYMSPEQAQGLPVDARADVYSFGCMLYESLTGRLPILAASALDFVARIVFDPPAAPSTLVEGIPPELDALVLALLAKSRRQRLGYIDDVAAALERLGARDDAPVAVSPYLYRGAVVGREREVAGLEAWVERARTTGAVVLVGGESGVGKTCLVADVAPRIGRRMRVVVGECRPADVCPGAPLQPLVPLLQAIGDYCRRAGPDAAARVLGPRAGRLAACEPGLAGIADATDGRAGDVSRGGVLAALRATLAAWIADAGEVLVLLDDLHHADDLTLAWLAGCAAEPLRRLAIVGTWRTDRAGAALRAVLATPGVARIDLAPLDRASVGRLVADMLALAEPPAGVVAVLESVSGGNPYLVAEGLRAMIDAGLLRRVQGRWTVPPSTGFARPRARRDFLGGRCAGVAAAYDLRPPP